MNSNYKNKMSGCDTSAGKSSVEDLLSTFGYLFLSKYRE
jgi:hypothetical protein